MFEFNTQNTNDEEITVTVYNVKIHEPNIYADNPDDYYGYSELDYEVFGEKGELCESYDAEEIEEEILRRYKELQSDASLQPLIRQYEDNNSNSY